MAYTGFNIVDQLVNSLTSVLHRNNNKHAKPLKIVDNSNDNDSLDSWDVIPESILTEYLPLNCKSRQKPKKSTCERILYDELILYGTDSGYSDTEDVIESTKGTNRTDVTVLNTLPRSRSIQLPNIGKEFTNCDFFDDVRDLVNTSRAFSNSINLETQLSVKRETYENNCRKCVHENTIDNDLYENITVDNTCEETIINNKPLINFNQSTSVLKSDVVNQFESSSDCLFNDTGDKVIDLSTYYPTVTSCFTSGIYLQCGSTQQSIMDIKNVPGKKKSLRHVSRDLCNGDINNNKRLVDSTVKTKKYKTKHANGGKFSDYPSDNTSINSCKKQIVDGTELKKTLNKHRGKQDLSQEPHKYTKIVQKDETVDNRIDKLKLCKDQQISLIASRRDQLHKMIDSWYEQLHNQLEFTYEQEIDRASTSSSKALSESDSDDSTALKSPSTVLCSVLNTHTSIKPQQFGTFNTHYAHGLDTDIWAYEMKETVHLRTFESRDIDVHTEYMATSLNVNKDGNFVISDLGADTCRVFTTEGQLICDFDIYPLSEPSYVLQLDNGCYLVACRDGLQLFNSKGEHKTNSFALQDIKCPQCVAIDQKGNYIVSDMHDCGSMIITLEQKSLLPMRVFCGSQFQESSMQFQKAWYIHVTSDNNIILSDRDDHTVKCYTQHGQFKWSIGDLGSKNGQFVTPAGVTEDKLGNIIVADCGNDRVQIFSGNGDWLGELVSEEVHSITSPMDVAITKDGCLAVLGSDGSVSVFKYLNKVA